MFVGGYVGSKIPQAFGTGPIIEESALGASTLTIDVTGLVLTDSATGSSILDTGIIIKIDDNALGSIVKSLNVFIPITETASGIEQVTLPSKIFYITDSSIGSSYSFIPINIVDQAAGSEVSNLFAYITPIDTALGSSFVNLTGIETIFDYTGSLNPGDILEIDAEQLLVELNDSNARANFDGDYPILKPGDTTIYYVDDETGRTVELEIIRKDKHI